MSYPCRTETIAGLRELADWLEANPGVPLPCIGVQVQYFPMASNTSNEVAELEALAAVIERAPRRGHPGGPHVKAVVHFQGDVSYEVVVCDVPYEAFEGRDETTRAGDSDLAPEVPAVATTQPGSDVTHGEGKVGSPVAGLPTAPDGPGAA